MGWGGFLDRVTSWIPIKTPAQRRREKIKSLETRIKEIENGPWTKDTSSLVMRLQRELDRLRDEAVSQ